MTASPVLSDVFREVMAGVATPVAVVTSFAGTRPHGTTVSSFTSLSLDPPMVLVALDRRSELLARLDDGTGFGVNVLGSAQADLALAFARRGASGFDGLAWEVDRGVPRLTGCSGWLACTVAGLVDGGDHVIVLGAVRGAEATPGAPLIYHARAFGTHSPLPADSVLARPHRPVGRSGPPVPQS